MKMFDYFEYVKFPEQKNVKFRYANYREDFNIQRNPTRFLLTDSHLAEAEAKSTKLYSSLMVSSAYIAGYFYFLNNLSQRDTRCNYILLRRILPSATVIFGVTYWLSHKFLVDHDAIRRHNKVKALLRNHEHEILKINEHQYYTDLLNKA